MWQYSHYIAINSWLYCKGPFINDVITGGGGGESQKMTNDDMMAEGGRSKITRPSEMEVYHRDTRNITIHKWPNEMI